VHKLRPAFTLIEILIATALLSVVLIGLYSSLDTQRRSVDIIKKNLDRSVNHDRVIMVLYNDILSSDGNITIKKGEKDTICIENTRNSLYELDSAKVCWLVLKEDNTLVRIEGNDYRLPLGLEDTVEIDRVLKGVKLFDITRKKGNILAVIQEPRKEPYSFLLQGIKQPPKPLNHKKEIKPVKGQNTNKDKNKTNDGGIPPEGNPDLFRR
jgi:prepilin-type N-terminal cleavage/methylation domain-containing protein